jgi:uncharacterized protein
VNRVRYVFDTNVIISSVLFEGSKPDLAIRYALQNGNILFSLELIEELDEVLSRTKFRKYITDEEREEFLNSFINRGILIEVVDVVKECRDPKDDKILELSLSGKTDLIISGDQDLLVLSPFRSVEILSVEQFLQSVSDYPNQRGWLCCLVPRSYALLQIKFITILKDVDSIGDRLPK